MESFLSIHNYIFLSVIGISVAPWSSSNERGFPCVMSCPGSEQDDGHRPAEFKVMAKPEDTQTYMDRRTTGQQSTDEPPDSISQQNQCITVSPLPVPSSPDCSPSPWPRFQGSAAAERAAESSACGSGASPLTCPSFYLLQGWIIIPLHFTHRSLNIKRKRKKQRKKKQQTEQISRELRNTSQ